MSRSLPATALPRAHEFTTRIVSTSACAEKKLRARSATSWWRSVGNLSGEIIDFSLRRTPALDGLTRIRLQREIHSCLHRGSLSKTLKEVKGNSALKIDK